MNWLLFLSYDISLKNNIAGVLLLSAIFVLYPRMRVWTKILLVVGILYFVHTLNVSFLGYLEQKAYERELQKKPAPTLTPTPTPVPRTKFPRPPMNANLGGKDEALYKELD